MLRRFSTHRGVVCCGQAFRTSDAKYHWEVLHVSQTKIRCLNDRCKLDDSGYLTSKLTTLSSAYLHNWTLVYKVQQASSSDIRE